MTTLNIEKNSTSIHKNSIFYFSLLVFCGYLTVGIPLAIIPLYVHNELNFGPSIVGAVIATQAVATLLSRRMAGAITDSKGAHMATYIGMLVCLASMALYALSSISIYFPFTSLFILIAGRVVLGIGESLFITGTLSWSIGSVGASHAGKAMVWTGIAMFGAIGAGAPIGDYIYHYGFSAVALASALILILGSLLLKLLQPIPIMQGTRLPFFQVIRRIWPQGLGLALSTIGFGTLFSFLGLYFAVKQWVGAPFGLSAFGISYIVARLIFGHLPDKFGGLPVARITTPCQCTGLAILWLAPSPACALIGCAIVGAGYSLTFPALGVDAIRRVPPQNRGAAMGAYVAFVDIGLGITGLISGSIAGIFGYTTAFFLAALASAGAFMLLITLR